MWEWIVAEGFKWNANRGGSTKLRNIMGVRGKKGSIIAAYLPPPSRTYEMGQIAVKTEFLGKTYCGVVF